MGLELIWTEQRNKVDRGNGDFSSHWLLRSTKYFIRIPRIKIVQTESLNTRISEKDWILQALKVTQAQFVVYSKQQMFVTNASCDLMVVFVGRLNHGSDRCVQQGLLQCKYDVLEACFLPLG